MPMEIDISENSRITDLTDKESTGEQMENCLSENLKKGTATAWELITTLMQINTSASL